MGWLRELGKDINKTFNQVVKNAGDQISLPVRMVNDASKGKDAWKTFTDTQKRTIGTDAYIVHGGPVVRTASAQITGNKTVKRLTGSWLTDAESGLVTMQKFGRQEVTQAEWNSVGKNYVRAGATVAAIFGGAALVGAYGGASAAGAGGAAAAGAGSTAGAVGVGTTAAASTGAVAAGGAAAAGTTAAATTGMGAAGWIGTVSGIVSGVGTIAKTLLGGGAAQAPASAPTSYIPDGYVPPGSVAGDYFGDGNYTTTSPALTPEQFESGNGSLMMAGLAAAVGVAYIAAKRGKK